MKRTVTFTICITLFLWMSFAAQAQYAQKKVLTIEDCVKIALKNSFQARSALESYNSAKWELLGGWSNLLPRLDLSSSWSRNSRPRTTRLVQPVTYRDLFRFNLVLSYTFFDGGATSANYYLKKSSKRAAWDDLKLAESSVALSVKEGCYNLLKAQMLYEVQKDAVKKSLEQLNMAKARFDLGSASLSDYLKAKVQLGNDSLNLITYANNVKLTEASLNSLLGLEIDTPLEIDAKLGYERLETDLDTEIRKALSIHSQIDKAKMGVDQAHSSLIIARSGNLPTISFFGDYSWADVKFPLSRSDWNNFDAWDVGIEVRMNLFEGFLTTSNVRSAKAKLDLAEESLKQAKRDLELEIRQAYLSVKEGEQKILLTEEALKSAEEDLKLTQEKYNLGAASILELLDANYSYKTAKSNQVQALYDYNLAVAKFEKAIHR